MIKVSDTIARPDPVEMSHCSEVISRAATQVRADMPRRILTLTVRCLKRSFVSAIELQKV